MYTHRCIHISVRSRLVLCSTRAHTDADSSKLPPHGSFSPLPADLQGPTPAGRGPAPTAPSLQLTVQLQSTQGLHQGGWLVPPWGPRYPPVRHAENSSFAFGPIDSTGFQGSQGPVSSTPPSGRSFRTHVTQRDLLCPVLCSPACSPSLLNGFYLFAHFKARSAL